jgi:hypothetical protein
MRVLDCVEDAKAHHRKHGDMDKGTCMLNGCAWHYPRTVTLPREQVERVLRVLERVVDDGQCQSGRMVERCPGDYCLVCKHHVNVDGHDPACDLAASIADLKALGL